jgi:Trk K+ transport system NAD-binding subunit
LIVVVGGDALAVRVCEELVATQGHRVALLWTHDDELAAKIGPLDCEYFPHHANDYDALRIAGIEAAASVMTLSDDDRLNLQVALKARDLNPNIRVVLRQFNQILGRKLEANLPDCSVLSPASHSAATFVATALDPSCFYALEFPGTLRQAASSERDRHALLDDARYGDDHDFDERHGVQVGFAERRAADFGIAGLTPRAAQQRLGLRIVAVGGSPEIPPARALAPDDTVIAFGRLERLEASIVGPSAAGADRRKRRARRFAVGARKRLLGLRTMDPILARVIFAAVTIFALAVVYFAYVLHGDPLAAFYFVSTTFTSTGYGDITPLGRGAAAMLLANVVMFAGVASSGIFIAFATAALTRAQFNAIQGLRQIRTRGHVLVCGSGDVGTRVIGYLRALHQRVVVVDSAPDPGLVEMSRRRQIELLTGDATRDATLDLCNVAGARAVVALTDSDTANLEVALGARARNPRVPIVMRAQDDAFAGSIARQFEAIRTYSTTALAAPAFAMLSRFPGTRGRIAFGDDSYNVGVRLQGEVPQPPPAEDCIPLGVWRKGTFLHVDTFEEMEPFDRLLFLVPLSQFKPEETQCSKRVQQFRTSAPPTRTVTT